MVLAKPMSYMNLSGGPVSSLAKYYGVPPAEVIVVHDELDLPLATVKLKRGGGSAGHNGLKDLTKALGGPDYIRVRVGIGRPPGSQDAASFVLKPFSAAERKEIDIVIAEAADAVEPMLLAGEAREGNDPWSDYRLAYPSIGRLVFTDLIAEVQQ